MNFMDTDFSVSNVAACDAKVAHSLESHLPQVAILNTTRDKWHRDITLHAVDACPRRHQCKYASDDIDEERWRVVLVATCSP